MLCRQLFREWGKRNHWYFLHLCIHCDTSTLLLMRLQYNLRKRHSADGGKVYVTSWRHRKIRLRFQIFDAILAIFLKIIVQNCSVFVWNFSSTRITFFWFRITVVVRQPLLNTRFSSGNQKCFHIYIMNQSKSSREVRYDKLCWNWVTSLRLNNVSRSC